MWKWSEWKWSWTVMRVTNANFGEDEDEELPAGWCDLPQCFVRTTSISLGARRETGPPTEGQKQRSAEEQVRWGRESSRSRACSSPHHTQRKRPNEAQQNSLSDTGSKWSGILGALISILSLFTYNTHHGTKNEMPHIPFTFSTSENIYTAMIRHSHSRLARAMFIGWLVQQGCAVEHWMVWILWLKKIIIHKLQDLNRCDVWTLNCDSHQLHSYVQTQPKNNLKNINRIGTI